MHRDASAQTLFSAHQAWPSPLRQHSLDQLWELDKHNSPPGLPRLGAHGELTASGGVCLPSGVISLLSYCMLMCSIHSSARPIWCGDMKTVASQQWLATHRMPSSTIVKRKCPF